MTRTLSLPARLSLALAGIAGASMLLLSAAVWTAHQRIEEKTLDLTLDRELDFLIEHRVPPQDVNPRSPSLQYYRPAQSARWRVPADFLALPPGYHHAVPSADQTFHVVVRDVAPGDRAYLASDIGGIERREARLLIAIGAALLLTLALALLASRRLARVSLQPLAQLVERIRALDPEGRGQTLALERAPPDLQPIVAVLNAHIAALDRVVERERSFAAAASHELRTPLAVISSAAQLHAAHPEQAVDACATIRGAVDSATQLLDGLLTLWRPAPAETLDLQRLLPGLAAESAAELRRYGGRIEWQLREPVSWHGARGVAAVIFGNLLRNALQARPGGTIEVGLARTALWVRDQGPGLDPALAERAFEPGNSSRSGGSGLGLYISRALARRHGGDVTLEAPPDGGLRAVWRFT